MFVISRESRVIVAGDTSDAALAEQADYLVRPRRITGEITEVIDRVKVGAVIDVGDASLQPPCPDKHRGIPPTL